MDSQDLRNLQEAYSNVYEQQIGVPLKDASDRAAKEQLKKMIPKGEKIHTPKATLQNAAYEPEGDEIEEDVRSRDVNVRGGFDPRFDRKPKTTGSGQVKTPGGPVKTPGGPVSTPRPTGPVAQAPKPNVGGVLGQLDKIARNTAGDIGSRIGEREGRNRTGNLPIISDIGGAIGRKQGREKGQRTYDNLKNTAIRTVGGLLKQDYEPDAFDVILEHLVAEGYADTNEDALVIMANMSEEWKNVILEKEDSEYEKASDAALDARYGYGRATGDKRSFGRAANRASAAAMLRRLRRDRDEGRSTSRESGADAVHQGWAHTARTSEDQTPEKKERRAKLADTSYSKLPEDEKEKDRVSADAVRAVYNKNKSR